MSLVSLVLFLLYAVIQFIYLMVKYRIKKSLVHLEPAVSDPVDKVIKRRSRFYKFRATECEKLEELLSGDESQIRKNIMDLLEICEKRVICQNYPQGTNQNVDSSWCLNPHIATEVTKVSVDELTDHTLRGLKIPLILQDRHRIIVAYKKNSGGGPSKNSSI